MISNGQLLLLPVSKYFVSPYFRLSLSLTSHIPRGGVLNRIISFSLNDPLKVFKTLTV